MTPKADAQLVTASNQLSNRLGVESAMMIQVIKAQCFRSMNPDSVSNAQLASYIAIANDLELNPLIPGMLYAYPDRGAIIPVVGPDGVLKKLSQLPGVTFECIVYPEDVLTPPTHATCNIYVDGKERPYSYTAVYSEWATPNWSKRPRHWNWLRAVKQCARQVIHGLPMDEDEAVGAGLVNVTPPEEDKPAEPRATGPARETQGAAAAKENAAKAETKTKRAAKGTAAAKKAAKAEAEAAEKAKAEAEAEAAKAAKKPTEGNVVEGEFTDVETVEKTKPVEPVTALTDDEPHTFENVRLIEIKRGSVQNVKNSVVATTNGSFQGQVYHIGGDCDAWEEKSTVTLVLKGRLLKRKEGDTEDRYAAMVESITPSA